jgi:hypothetical protein
VNKSCLRALVKKATIRAKNRVDPSITASQTNGDACSQESRKIGTMRRIVTMNVMTTRKNMSTLSLSNKQVSLLSESRFWADD